MRDNVSLPGIAGDTSGTDMHLLALLFRCLVFERQSLALRIEPAVKRFAKIRCVIVVINDPYYHSEALNRRGVKETVITRSRDTR